MVEQCITFRNLDVQLPCALADLPTPCLLVDEEVVMQNCNRMLDKVANPPTQPS
jgi:D-serine deaminase-like pyridoxal phosphate-dependent protein